MMLKKFAFVAAVCALPALAQANNTIRFVGEVTAQTCSVSVNGLQANPVVLLPSVAVAQLNRTGNAGETPFTISVQGCTANEENPISVSTVFVAADMTTAGNIANTTGTASNVELQLLNAVNGTPVNLRTTSSVPLATLAAGSTSAERQYAIRYFTPSNNATAGSVGGSLQYSLAYP
ncbi:MAG: fimbrial protein [Limnobacter sp.]|uniref:fimbrial protein n=1 Tax=unclassified Limnobacter TaxID=2630203 RepID=UPI000CF495DE|nr:fimbrial protein [Limnobacter sp. SAORIC-690]PQJ26015.1 hypothetical protein BSZ31_14725 [Limnobacter sp. SAORIC-690]